MPDHNEKNEKGEEQRKNDRLDEIRRARSRLFVCFWTFPVYVLVVTRLLSAGNGINVVMYAYMLLYAAFGLNAAVKRCPQCNQQFFVKRYFLNPFYTQCAHCRLSFKHSG